MAADHCAERGHELDVGLRPRIEKIVAGLPEAEFRSGLAEVVKGLQVLSELRPLPAITLSEALATSDVPGGVINLITGRTAEVAPWLARRGVRMHQEVQPRTSYTYFNLEHPMVGGYEPAQVALRRGDRLHRQTFVNAVIGDADAEPDGYDYVVNGRFRGGWITRHYGDPENGVHAIQMELAQRAYLTEEAPPWSFDPAKAEHVRAVLKPMLHRLSFWATRA